MIISNLLLQLDPDDETNQHNHARVPISGIICRPAGALARKRWMGRRRAIRASIIGCGVPVSRLSCQLPIACRRCERNHTWTDELGARRRARRWAGHAPPPTDTAAQRSQVSADDEAACPLISLFPSFDHNSQVIDH